MPATTSPPAPLKTFGLALGLIALRMVGMVLVAVTMPLAHEAYGEVYAGDGQQTSGIIVLSGLVGFMAVIFYMLTATVAHLLVMKKTIQTKLWMEAGILLTFISVLTYLGITAQ